MSDITFNPTVGTTINDGTCVWTVKKCLPTEEIGGWSLSSIINSGNNLIRSLLTTMNGKLEWSDNYTSDNNNLNDLGGSAIVAMALGTRGYIKYTSGLIVQWTYIPTVVGAGPLELAYNLPACLPSGISNAEQWLWWVARSHSGDYIQCNNLFCLFQLCRDGFSDRNRLLK
jgi:hypothetical protein